jgi:hypothetical protein
MLRAMQRTLILATFLAACGTGTNQGPGPDPNAPDVLGAFDRLDPDGSAAGWALTPWFGTHPLETVVYADGDAATGTLIYTVRANQTRDDVADATGVPGEHGFAFALPDALKDGKPHELHVYGMGPTGLVELTGSPRSITVDGSGEGTAPRVEDSGEVLGHIDDLGGNGDVIGWTLVPSFTSHPIQIAVFANGDPKTGTLLFTSRANVDRADLGSVFGSTHHGYHVLVPEELMNEKPQSLSIYGIGPGGFTELPGSPRNFQLASPKPIGVVDVVDANGVLTGWALAPSMAAAPIDVDLFLDDPAGTKVATVHADQPRGDVNQATGIAGDHGFSFALPEELRDEMDHHLYAVAVGPRSNVMLGDVPFHLAPLVHKRKGIVHADGRNYVDDDGAFYPVGGTLMWALYGWKYDRARLEDNLKYLSDHHYDYVRILAEVQWPGEMIEPSWPDYAQVLGEFVDTAYNKYGLRSEITIIGSGDGIDVMALAQTVATVVNAGRRHEVLDIEVANESYQRPVSLAQMRAAGSYLMQALPGQLVALSSAEGVGAYVPNGTDFRQDSINTYLQPGTANLLTIHMDRTFGDGGWREVRQPWDWKDFPAPISHNEPIGPRSSVAQDADPVRLATLRAVGIINGVEAFVLHNGAGVMGRLDPAHDRPPNLWEVPGIDGVMTAVRGVDAILPPHAGDGQHWNNAWAGNPWVADAFWGDGANHGVNRNYTVATTDGWCSIEAGIKDHVVMTASRHSRVEIFDILGMKVNEVELQGGQTLTLTPVSADSNGYGSLVIIGHYL